MAYVIGSRRVSFESPRIIFFSACDQVGPGRLTRAVALGGNYVHSVSRCFHMLSQEGGVNIYAVIWNIMLIYLILPYAYVLGDTIDIPPCCRQFGSRQ